MLVNCKHVKCSYNANWQRQLQLLDICALVGVGVNRITEWHQSDHRHHLVYEIERGRERNIWMERNDR